MALQRIMLEGEESRGLMNWKQGWHKQHRTITTMLEFHDVSRNMAAPFRMVQNHENVMKQKKPGDWEGKQRGAQLRTRVTSNQ